jgi:hypothetical protein
VGIFRNYYRCPECSREWEDERDCPCDDRCAECGAKAVSPYRSEEVKDTKTPRIRALNDTFRRSFQGGQVLMTRGISGLPPDTCTRILRRVREFTAFSAANDPYGEHNFGNFEEEERKVYWKIDYYDSKMTYSSADAADPRKTVRVLTVMLAEEY